MSVKNNEIKKEKDPGRVAIVKKIEQFEREGKWTIDVEEDPPTIPLQPDQVDYLYSRLIDRIIARLVTDKAFRFIKKLIKTKKMIIKEIRGFENFKVMADQGCLITCNHFNPFDNFCIHWAVRPFLLKHHRELWIVIREGNYTNFPGFYGLLMRHCHTLPLSANFSTMKKFVESMKVLLGRGEKVLIFPEQAMWWNYRKPRPMTNGAFKFAVDSDVPVLPMFITMNDSEIIGDDGFPVQEYTLHIAPAIYPDPEKSKKENMEYLKNQNYEVWKKIYEDFYGIPLTYTTEK